MGKIVLFVSYLKYNAFFKTLKYIKKLKINYKQFKALNLVLLVCKTALNFKN